MERSVTIPIDRPVFWRPMAVFFRNSITEATAFEMIEERLSSGNDFDGYFNVYGTDDELTVSWTPAMSSAEFKEQVTDALRSIWQTAHFWLVYQRSDSRNDLGINEIRNAAIRLSGSYLETAVVTLCLLGRIDNKNDLELIFLCFREETERRNFRVRYEGKFVPDAPQG
ncbi:translation initiation factor RLI1 [Rhizobium herbae]|uniref:Translation initiation factor RLI1 n=2 Tax=Rhizobium herbae TaxID=508661 RepID=A0ABS4EUC1_9HYPH|nr:translation initiation factor RLI1 [Rhizobium herbae]